MYPFALSYLAGNCCDWDGVQRISPVISSVVVCPLAILSTKVMITREDAVTRMFLYVNMSCPCHSLINPRPDFSRVGIAIQTSWASSQEKKGNFIKLELNPGFRSRMLSGTGRRLGFVGAGQMAKAIGFPLVEKGKLSWNPMISVLNLNCSSWKAYWNSLWRSRDTKTESNYNQFPGRGPPGTLEDAGLCDDGTQWWSGWQVWRHHLGSQATTIFWSSDHNLSQ